MIRVGLDGWVPTENYGEVVKHVQIVNERMLEVAENEEQRKEIAEHWLLMTLMKRNICRKCASWLK